MRTSVKIVLNTLNKLKSFLRGILGLLPARHHDTQYTNDLLGLRTPSLGVIFSPDWGILLSPPSSQKGPQWRPRAKDLLAGAAGRSPGGLRR